MPFLYFYFLWWWQGQGIQFLSQKSEAHTLNNLSIVVGMPQLNRVIRTNFLQKPITPEHTPR